MRVHSRAVKTALRIIAAVSMAAFAVSAQTPDPRTLGPKVGERVPDFRLPDQHGATRSLHEILGPKGAVLVFFRSADW
mgnify:CR=1 FL=1